MLKNWEETLSVTQPYRFDKNLNMSSNLKHGNLPHPRDGGFRVGAPIVRDTIMQEVQDCKLKEVYSQSIFAKAKRSPRGIKRGGINLQYGLNGGFKNVIAPKTPTVDLNDILQK